MDSFKKLIKKHNKVALSTGENKQRHKLIKSKHGWRNIAIGVTFASMGIIGTGIGVSADTVASNSAPQTTTPSQTQKNPQNETDSNAKESDNQIQNDNQVSLSDNHESIQSNNNSDSKETTAPIQTQKDSQDETNSNTKESSNNLANKETTINGNDKNNSDNLNDSNKKDISDQNSKIINKSNDTINANTNNSNNDNSVQSEPINNNVSNMVLATNLNNDIHTGIWGSAKYVYNENSKTLTFRDGGDLGNEFQYDNYLEYNYRQVEHVIFENKVKVDDTNGLFARWSNVKDYTNLYNLDTSNCTNFSNMFLDNHNLTKIDLTGLNTDKATAINAMFWTNAGTDGLSGTKLTYVNLGGINTANVTNMSSMFNNDQNLTRIDGLNQLNTSNVINMNAMFQSLYSMTNLDVSSFNTTNVTDMNTMFSGFGVWAAYYDNAIPTIDGLEKFNTSNVTNMKDMFNGTWAYELNVSAFNTSKVVNMSGMFNYDVNLEFLDLSNWDTRNVTSMNNMFADASSLNRIKLGKNTLLNSSANLPDVSSNYRGWVQVDSLGNVIPGESSLSSKQITNGNDHVGTWIWGNPIASKASITGKDVIIYVGDQLNNADFDASATDKAGNSEAVTIDTSKVDTNKPGVYDVTITATDGQTKTVTVTVLANKGQAQINVNPSETLATGNNWEPIDSIKSIIDENSNNVNVQNALNDGSLKTTLTSLSNKQNNVKFISFARVNSDGTTSIVTLDDIHNVKGTYICTYLFEGQLAQTTLFVGTNNTDSVANSIIFEDPQGNVIGSPFVITGQPGDTESITSHIPTGYHLVNDDDKIITLSRTKETFIILIEKDSVTPSNNGNNTPNNNVPDNNGDNTPNNNVPSDHNTDNGNHSGTNTTNKDRISDQVVNKTKTNQNTKGDLPQTGEELKDSALLSMIGVILLNILGLLRFKKIKK